MNTTLAGSSPILQLALPALIAAAAALVVALISLYSTRMNARKTRDTQVELQRYQKDLKLLQSSLDDKNAERDARRDYEYEARKRLYQECSPLLFQLSEQANSVCGRIENIARAAAQGNLGSGPNSWLTASRHRYYRLSTEYRLLAPLATTRLLQQRLTYLDLSLDPDIRLIYTLGRKATRIFGADFDLAALGPVRLEYDPHNANAETLREQRPAVYRQQGVPQGVLDNALEAMLVKFPDEPKRVMTFLEYETARKASLSASLAKTHGAVEGQAGPGLESGAATKAFDRINYLIPNFHPADRPVLWRVLLSFAGVYGAMSKVLEGDRSLRGLPSAEDLFQFTAKQRETLDWRADTSLRDNVTDMDAALEASRVYLTRELAPDLERLRGAQRPPNGQWEGSRQL